MTPTATAEPTDKTSWVAPAPEVLDRLLDQARFDRNGLLAAIAQDEEKNILMLAWMNREALRETLASGRVCYFSRSRAALWRKGERSGQRQLLLDAAFDCDGDALLMTVRQTGVACHTGRRSCFYREVTPEGLHDKTAPLVSPQELYGASTP